MHPDDIDAFFHVRSWLAVLTDDHEEVARLLGAVDRRVCSFDEYATAMEGPRTDRDEGFFVCEPVDGWTLVFGEAIGNGVPAEVKARKFKQVHAFYLDDKRGNYFCERAIDGTTVRQVASADGEYSAEGHPDPGEPDLPAQEGQDEVAGPQRVMSQDRVLRIAEAWGADPTQMLGRVRAGLWCRTTAAPRDAEDVRRGKRRSMIVVAPLIVAIVLGLLAVAIR